MTNPRLAQRYAKSIFELSKEQNLLTNVYEDMKYLQAIIRSNPDLNAMLRSPVISSDKKEKIINAVTEGKITELTRLFVKLLTGKSREGNLGEIAASFIEQYNQLKNIKIVKLTTAVAVSDEIKHSLVAKVKQSIDADIQLETSVNADLIGGFKLEIGDTLVDASILRDLNDVRRQFLNNEYLHSIR